MEIAIPLTIIFVVLRLTHVIGWSWWWVFSPLWIGGIITGIMYGVFGVVSLFGRFFESQTETIRSKKRIAFCIIGVVLFWFAQWQKGIAFQYYGHYESIAGEILLTLAYFFAIFGSYIWAKEKGRSGWWCLMGLIAPIGYIVLMKLKDKHVLKEVAAPAQQQTMPIILPSPMEQQPTMNFCPECGHKVTEQMTYCPNCGRKLSSAGH